MKTVTPSTLVNSFAFSKICLGSSISFADPSNFTNLLGYRQSLFSLINPFSFQYSLKTCFLFLNSFVRNKYDFIFIANIKDSVLFNKFFQICKGKKYSLLKDSEMSTGFLTNKKGSKTVIITLFLDHRKTELIKKESLLMNVPLISFSDLASNKLSSTLYLAGNYNSFLSQNLILTLITVCLEQKHEYS